MIISSKEAKLYLETELEKEGFFADSKNWEKAWCAFKSFSNYQIECANDDFLWQTGTYNFTGKEEFSCEIVRQFSHVDNNGEYTYMEQLTFTFYYEPSELLLQLEGNVWSIDFDSTGDFFSHVEKLDSFNIPIEKFLPTSYKVAFYEV